MSAQAHYFKIGVFVIAASVLFTLAVLVLGAGRIFEKRIYLETYINESVQGLDIGTPIKFRGVPIGSIKDIDFVFNIYPEVHANGNEQRLIYILMQVSPKAFGMHRSEPVQVFLEREVKKGLRVKVAPQGLTGQFYIDLDYMNPAQYPSPEINWNPTYHYIPSVKSTISFFTDSITEVFGRLQRFNFEGLLSETTTTLHAVRAAVEEADIAGVSREMRTAMRSIQTASNRLNNLFENTNLTNISSDTMALITSARRVLEDNEANLAAITSQLNKTLSTTSRIAGRLDAYLESEEGKNDVKSLRAAVSSLSQATQNLSSSFDRTLGHADRLMTSHQHDLEVILDNLRQITENLNAITEQARGNPSQVIFGEPPPALITVPKKE